MFVGKKIVFESALEEKIVIKAQAFSALHTAE